MYVYVQCTRDGYSFEIDPSERLHGPKGRDPDSARATVGRHQIQRGTVRVFRGNALRQSGNYHGELNVVAAVDPFAGVISLAWPLS